MRVVRRGARFINVTCKRCGSLIEMLPDELSKVGPMGPYDMDYDGPAEGTRYFRCPVSGCGHTTYLDHEDRWEDHDL